MFPGHNKKLLPMILPNLSYFSLTLRLSLSLSLSLRSGQALLPRSSYHNTNHAAHSLTVRQQLPITSNSYYYRHHHPPPSRDILAKSLLMNEASQEQEQQQQQEHESVSTTTTTVNSSETSSMNITTDINNALPQKDNKNYNINYFLDIFGLVFKWKSLQGPTATIIMPIITIILACTRPIPFGDFFFSISFPLYLCFANRFRFDRNKNAIDAGKGNKLPSLREGSGPWLKPYMLTFASIGLLLPLLFQIVASITATVATTTATVSIATTAAEVAAPHLYLILCQVVMESLTTGPRFHSLTQLMVPIGFNTYRLFSLNTWVRTACRMVVMNHQDATSRTMMMSWNVLGLGLAVANGLIWTYNLFVFLLLRILPQYINRQEFPVADVTWKGQLIPILASTSTSSTSGSSSNNNNNNKTE